MRDQFGKGKTRLFFLVILCCCYAGYAEEKSASGLLGKHEVEGNVIVFYRHSSHPDLHYNAMQWPIPAGEYYRLVIRLYDKQKRLISRVATPCSDGQRTEFDKGFFPGVRKGRIKAVAFFSTEVLDCSIEADLRRHKGDFTPDDIPMLIKVLIKTEDDMARIHAAKILHKMGMDAEPAADALLAALEDDEEEVQAYAVQALAKIGETRAIPLIRERLNRFGIRKQMAYALGVFGPKAQEAVPDLIRMLKDPDVRFRDYVLVALEMIGTPEAKNALAQFHESQLVSAKPVEAPKAVSRKLPEKSGSS